MTFQTTVILIAEVILAISIFIIGMTLYRKRANALYPPIISDCPDYWEIDGTTCKRVDVGLAATATTTNRPLSCETQNFGIPIYKGNNGLCEKQKWAKSCNDVIWDGITNNNDLCH